MRDPVAWARVASLVDHIQVLYCFDHCDHGGFDDYDHVCYIALIIPIMTIMVVSTIINNNVLTCDHVCAIQDFHSVDHYDHDANDGFNDDHHNNVFKIQERANTVEWEVILSAINIFIIFIYHDYHGLLAYSRPYHILNRN